MSIKFATAVAFLVATGTASYSQSYVCNQTSLTGFVYENDRWSSTDFNAKTTYLINISGDSVEIKEFGYETPSYWPSDCALRDIDSVVLCDNLYGQFRFSINHLKYIESHINGFYRGPMDTYETPYVSIGHCVNK